LQIDIICKKIGPIAP